MVKDHNYVVAFKALDMDKKGKINEKNIQTFLMLFSNKHRKHKYFFKPS